jgi:hypothetical protein
VFSTPVPVPLIFAGRLRVTLRLFYGSRMIAAASGDENFTCGEMLSVTCIQKGNSQEILKS